MGRAENILKTRLARQEKTNQKEALRLANVAANAKRTPQEKLALLDFRLGKGVGAVKSRARYLRQISEQKGKKTG